MKTIAYMGWLGHKNIGDEACFAAIHEMLPKEANIICWDINLWDKDVLPDISIVGGGTLINIEYDVRGKAITDLLNKGIPTVFWGTGVLQHTGVVVPEVVEMLTRSEFVGLRGPYSKAVLPVGSTVIGDPAFLLETKRVPLGMKSKVIAINVGDARKRLIGTEDDIVKHLKIVIRQLLIQRYEVVLFPMWVDDMKYINKLQTELSPLSVKIRNWSSSHIDLMDFFTTCRCVIGMKLHSSVLSAAANVPFISIAYREKCVDFAASLELERWVIHANDFNLSTRILDLLYEVPKYYDDIVDRFHTYKNLYKVAHVIPERIVHRIFYK